MGEGHFLSDMCQRIITFIRPLLISTHRLVECPGLLKLRKVKLLITRLLSLQQGAIISRPAPVLGSIFTGPR